MRTVFVVVVVGILAGCAGPAAKKKVLTKEEEAAEKKELFTVDFQESQTLRYRFVSSRDIQIDWGPAKGTSKRGKDKADKSTEKIEMVIAYAPVEVNPYGLTTIRATCESVKVTRSSKTGRRSAKDAAESIAGKSFTLKVGATGAIEDYSELDKLIRQAGEKAFRKSRKGPRTKEPDMIEDFISTQWFMWDSVASIEKPAEGVSVGQTWKSKLSVPNPLILRKARAVTYKLNEIRETQEGRIAVIGSTYSLAESVPDGWPKPYPAGSFQMAGKFGFLLMFSSGFDVQDLRGQAEELFNIDAGRTERYSQKYKMQIQASSRMPLPGLSPRITIEQKLTMRRVKN